MNVLKVSKEKITKPIFSANGVYFNGELINNYGDIDRNNYHEDPLHLHKKFGLIVPATNTTMEKEIWSILINNHHVASLRNIGFHTSNVVTPKPEIKNEIDREFYKKSFLAGLKDAVDIVKLSDPDYLILGMSLEHILLGIDEVAAPVNDAIATTDLHWSTCHAAIDSALRKYQAKNIGIITPFEAHGNASARKMFCDLGYNVVADVGLACGNTQHIAHIPDDLKKKAILDLLDAEGNKLDAIVQCGTNMSFVNLAEALEPRLGIPLLSINAVVLWHALRTNGISDKLVSATRIFRDH
ncbi:hypothetical protein RND59_00305 [Vibrio ruber]|uniref:Maleate isomerase n=1 Tax=Vibrio ruber (strain DSM 16370 / JCM 11486 / BCRC 17186 / CECT 7878 / LMG 23124 / VR1) TaxID=1123498 RepID=A0A1R4LS07_VIBR1|nr:hypothetical protein [Vibrio ruber]WNJ95598.1 hypothetical protein RND59_00305 [Vibrio ruber]SJN59243.1 Maleate isomerase [Vibrio ruber DSM 16370]